MPEQEPTIDIIMALLSLGQQSELAAFLLFQYCEIEKVAVKMAEISDEWIPTPLPTPENNLKLIMVILCHERARQYLNRASHLQPFLISLLDTREPEIVDSIGVVELSFPISRETITKLHEVQFLPKYIEISCALNNPAAMIRCIEFLKWLSKVAFHTDYFLVLPALKNLLVDPTGSWQMYAISLLATMTRYEAVRAEIHRQDMVPLISAVRSGPAKHLAKLFANMGITQDGSPIQSLAEPFNSGFNI
jgi:hypothetical protein